MEKYKPEELESIARAAGADGANERTYRRYVNLGLAEVVEVGGRTLLTPRGREQCRAIFVKNRERRGRSTLPGHPVPSYK